MLKIKKLNNLIARKKTYALYYFNATDNFKFGLLCNNFITFRAVDTLCYYFNCINSC